MTEEQGKKKRKPLGLNLSSPVDGGTNQEHIRQSLSHGRSKTVTVEIKRKRAPSAGDASAKAEGFSTTDHSGLLSGNGFLAGGPSHLTTKEHRTRMRAVQEALLAEQAQQEQDKALKPQGSANVQTSGLEAPDKTSLAAPVSAVNTAPTQALDETPYSKNPSWVPVEPASDGTRTIAASSVSPAPVPHWTAVDPSQSVKKEETLTHVSPLASDSSSPAASSISVHGTTPQSAYQEKPRFTASPPSSFSSSRQGSGYGGYGEGDPGPFQARSYVKPASPRAQSSYTKPSHYDDSGTGGFRRTSPAGRPSSGDVSHREDEGRYRSSYSQGQSGRNHSSRGYGGHDGGFSGGSSGRYGGDRYGGDTYQAQQAALRHGFDEDRFAGERSRGTYRPDNVRQEVDSLWRAREYESPLSRTSRGFRSQDAVNTGHDVPLTPGFKDTSSFVEAALRRRNAKDDNPHVAKSEGPANRRGALHAAANKKRERTAGGKIALVDDGTEENIYRPVLGLKKLRKQGGGRMERRNAPAGAAKSSVQRVVLLKPGMDVAFFADQLGEKVPVVVRLLHKMGLSDMRADTIVDLDVAQLLAQDRGCDVKEMVTDNPYERLLDQPALHPVTRPPVVTVMGHVDHGKTSLLDALRKTDVVSKEAGGITQHIGAYQVRTASGGVITFIDTPGHKAFTHMRARGARVTDIVVLVVAADDGINDQTVEAIRHCQAANVPIIVAINKMDKSTARPDDVRNQLLSYELVVERLGGTIQDVELSALKRMNLDGLEEAILLQAEMLELKADAKMRAKAVVLETCMKKGHGAVATVLVQEGTLRKGDVFVAGQTWGRVRLMFDDKGAQINQALPSQPVEVVGFDQMCQSGDTFVVAPHETEAKACVAYLKAASAVDDSGIEIMDAAAWLQKVKASETKEQTIVVKADTQGSLEGIAHELAKIQHDEIQVKIIHQAVGPVNEGDVLLAQAAGALLVSFGTSILPEARKLVEEKAVRLLSYRIIYQVVDEVREILSGMLAPVFEEERLGRAEVIQVFALKKAFAIAGCMIRDGLLRRNEFVRVMRGKKVIHEGVLRSLKHLKDDVKEKAAGHECGVMVDGYTDFQVGDMLECFTKKRIERSV